jgi:hypothetical protein
LTRAIGGQWFCAAFRPPFDLLRLFEWRFANAAAIRGDGRAEAPPGSLCRAPLKNIFVLRRFGQADETIANFVSI